MAESETKPRLAPEIFDIPLQKIRRGYFSAVYFWREKIILEKTGYSKKILMQIFQKNKAVLCGTDEAIAVLKLCTGYYNNHEMAYGLFDRYLVSERMIRQFQAKRDYQALGTAIKQNMSLEKQLDNLWVDKSQELEVNSLYDRDIVQPWETVMTLEGVPQYFAHLESVYLGILARRTLVATNVTRVVEAAEDKPVLFFADRFDHFANQTGDGYAATCGGAGAVATDTMGEWWGNQGVGTMPHALIACFNGDTVMATAAFAGQYPKVPCISLVDFHNDCVNTSLLVADEFKRSGLKLWGVRLDTSENMVDFSICRESRMQMGSEKPTGVNPMLVNNVRQALDKAGYGDVKIGVSGGFNVEKIRYFEKQKVPVDFYGCGSSLLKGNNDFTADIVLVNGKHCAKAGRRFRPNPKLSKIT